MTSIPDDHTPAPLTAEDEARHPEWPVIQPDATLWPGCESIRAQYNRTRCLAFGCERCWKGPRP